MLNVVLLLVVVMPVALLIVFRSDRGGFAGETLGRTAWPFALCWVAEPRARTWFVKSTKSNEAYDSSSKAE